MRPEYTADVDAMGTLRLLEAIRILGLEKKTRFSQASTSELYGLVQETLQKETPPLYPRSPCTIAKFYWYWIAVNYREACGMYACNGILFIHESPRYGETFVTRKTRVGWRTCQQRRNHRIAKVRARIENVFAAITQMGGKLIRTIGQARADFGMTMVALCYNIKRLT